MNIISKFKQQFKKINYEYEKLIKDPIAYYQLFLSSIQIHQLECKCGCKGNSIKYGFYRRYIKTPSGYVELKIQRVYCKHCHSTYALLPDWIVAYSQILLRDQLVIVYLFLNGSNEYSKVMDSNPFIDESNISYLLKKFKLAWKERLLSYEIKLNDDISINCFNYCNMQFMQIKRHYNIIYCRTNTT